MSEGVYLPVFHHFENGNVFTGSLGAFRYQITPDIHMKTQKEVDYEASSVKAEYWHGEMSYEFSSIEGEKTFALSREAYAEMRQWLNDAL